MHNVEKMRLRGVLDVRINGIVVGIARLNNGKVINLFVILYLVIKRRKRKRKSVSKITVAMMVRRVTRKKSLYRKLLRVKIELVC